MRYRLLFGKPRYFEEVGKTMAIVEVDSTERIKAGDHFSDPRGDIWQVEAVKPHVTLFALGSGPTLGPQDELAKIGVEYLPDLLNNRPSVPRRHARGALLRRTT